MNIQDYISSGIIESYVLGLASAEQREEFERMCADHPEVRQAREIFESSLEEFALMNGTTPPKNLKSKIFAAIDMEADGNGFNSAEPSVVGTAPVLENGRVKQMQSAPRYLAAASIILLLASTALNFYFFNKYREYDRKYSDLLITQSELATHNQALQTRLLAYEKSIDLMKDPHMAVIKMQAMPASPDPSSATTIYWDTNSKDVYLAVNQLPAPAPEQQYQLWAMVDGVPVDAGVFDVNNPGIVKMKNIPRAEAFAVTLEKKGGSPKPSMDKLYVLGKV